MLYFICVFFLFQFQDVEQQNMPSGRPARQVWPVKVRLRKSFSNPLGLCWKPLCRFYLGKLELYIWPSVFQQIAETSFPPFQSGNFLDNLCCGLSLAFKIVQGCFYHSYSMHTKHTSVSIFVCIRMPDIRWTRVEAAQHSSLCTQTCFFICHWQTISFDLM